MEISICLLTVSIILFIYVSRQCILCQDPSIVNTAENGAAPDIKIDQSNQNTHNNANDPPTDVEGATITTTKIESRQSVNKDKNVENNHIQSSTHSAVDGSTEADGWLSKPTDDGVTITHKPSTSIESSGDVTVETDTRSETLEPSSVSSAAAVATETEQVAKPGDTTPTAVASESSVILEVSKVPSEIESSYTVVEPVTIDGNADRPDATPTHSSADPMHSQAVDSALEADDAISDGDKEFPSFTEWTQKVLAEQEKTKQEVQQELAITGGNSLTQKQKMRNNVASFECGAKLLSTNPEAVNSRYILNQNRDEYMINPCTAKKWFTVELCEPVQIKKIEIASLELFSSQPKSFRVLISDRYPPKEWHPLGTLEATALRAIQSFQISEENYVKYVRVEMTEHFGEEHFCPLTFFRVFGFTMDEDYEYHEDGDASLEGTVDGGDDLTEGDEEPTRNLFTSAKDTVLSLVKKVLNVEEEKVEVDAPVIDPVPVEVPTVLLPNATIESGDALPASGADQANITKNGVILPCVPDARTTPIASDNKGDSDGKIHPTAPDVSIGDKSDEALVTKLEDDEQMPSENNVLEDPNDWTIIPAGLKLMKAGYNMSHIRYICNPCLEIRSNLSVLPSLSTAKICWYARSYMGHLWSNQTCMQENTDKREKSDCKSNGRIEESIQSEVHYKHVNTHDISASAVVPESNILTDKSPSESEVGDTISTKHTSDESPSMEDKRSSDTTQTEEFAPTSRSNSVPVSTTRSDEVHSSIVDMQIIPKEDVSEKVEIHQDVQNLEEILPPKPSSILEDNDVILESSSSLSNTESDIPSNVVPTPTLSRTNMLSDSAPNVEEATDEVIKVDKPVEFVTEVDNTAEKTSIARTIISHEPSATIDFQPSSLTDFKSTAASNVDSTSDVLSSQPGTDGSALIKAMNMTGGDGTRDLQLVKIQPILTGKRDTAVMRLSNRLKSLELNVSLSSRFLEELSQRFKKQSEDMMKLLNRTVIKLSNTTKAAEGKDSMHQEHISFLEGKIENLTGAVVEMADSIEALKQQLSESRGPWPSMEVVVVISILIALSLWRGRSSYIHPDVQRLLDNLPAGPGPPTTKRRNSTGNVAPLIRSITENHADYFIVDTRPVDFENSQNKEGNKKKKKKKHKNLESKSSSHMGERECEERAGMSGSRTTINAAGLLFEAAPQRVVSPHVQTIYRTMSSGDLHGNGHSRSSSGASSKSDILPSIPAKSKKLKHFHGNGNLLKQCPPCMNGTADESQNVLQAKTLGKTIGTVSVNGMDNTRTKSTDSLKSGAFWKKMFSSKSK